MSGKNVVTFLTQNQKLCQNLQAAFDGLLVIKAENIEAVNNTVKHNAVGAVVLHITGTAGWIIFEMLKTGYPNIPRYAILAPNEAGKDYDIEKRAKDYGAGAIIRERDGIRTLAVLIESQIKDTDPKQVGTKESFLEIYGELAKETERLQRELTVTGMRVLPQSEVGNDTKERLREALGKLKAVRILP